MRNASMIGPPHVSVHYLQQVDATLEKFREQSNQKAEILLQ